MLSQMCGSTSLPDNDVTNASVDIKGRVEKKPGVASVAGKYVIRGLMALAECLCHIYC
jgi:hypothetical protein